MSATVASLPALFARVTRACLLRRRIPCEQSFCNSGPRAKKFLRRRATISRMGTAPSSICRLFTVVDSKNSYPGLMSQTESPVEFELDRLRTVVHDYEKKLSEAAELVARVRHEINNPLAALLGQAQLLLREDLSEKSRRRAETIESQAKRIEQIVGELRAVQAPPTAVNNQG